jgi:glycosyltransferase involved in cell wall biosynthesis
MYIAHIANSITLSQTVFNQMIYQREKGHHVVALCPEDQWSRPLRYKDIEVIHVPFLLHDAKASMTSALLRTFLVCRQKQFDVVHTHTLLPGVAGRMGARFAGVPCVVHTFHSWPPHLYKSLAFKWGFYASEIVAAYSAHAILFQNPDDMQCWKEIPAVPSHKATLVGNGIDFSAITKKAGLGARERIRREFDLNEEDYVIVNVARFEPQKGHSFLLQALKDLIPQVNQKVVVLLVGNGTEQEKIEAETKQLGLQDMVRFTGYRKDVPDLLAAADVSVMTSHYEGIPRALMESMAIGLPVVATDVPGTRSLIRPNQTGFLVKYGDISGFSSALVKLLTNPSLARRLGQKGKDLVQAEFNEFVVADRVEEIYNHVLNNKSGTLPHWTLDIG